MAHLTILDMTAVGNLGSSSSSKRLEFRVPRLEWVEVCCMCAREMGDQNMPFSRSILLRRMFSSERTWLLCLSG